ncbi:toxin-antitoxin system YwqK family antitoxin [Chitiniphilus shinanonensis]|uniref:toxin-antitoxin system YwqK family antitoxin n=1 Tax=Chitiniphilus shinanonensis TaxID=553088 RepID=UPI00306E0735
MTPSPRVDPWCRLLAPLLLAASVLCLPGCGKSPLLEYRNAELVNGKFYEAGANEPFSGKLVNVPYRQHLRDYPGASAIIHFLGIAYKINGLDLLNVRSVQAVCDLETDDGIVHGAVICRLPGETAVWLTVGFADGRPDGPLEVFEPQRGQLLMEVPMRDGQPTGELVINDLDSGNQRMVFRFEGGVGSGEELQFDPHTGNRVFMARLVNWRYEGELLRYAPDGKTLILRAQFQQGLQHGPEEHFYPDTGKPSLYLEWQRGFKDGRLRRWDQSGALVEDKIVQYEHTLQDLLHPVPPSTAAETTVPATDTAPELPAEVQRCVDAKVQAFRDERGADEPIRYDFIAEWEQDCRAGR